MRDRETWMIAICYWVIGVGLIWGFLWQRLPMPWPIALGLTIALAPLSFLSAAYERRSEGERAGQRETLRSQGRFEEAAAQDTGAYYVLGMIAGGSYLGLGLFFLIGGVALASPGAWLGALFFGGWGVWRLHRYTQWRKEELEHQRTSAQRIAMATKALESGGWRARSPAAPTAANPPSSSDASAAGPTN